MVNERAKHVVHITRAFRHREMPGSRHYSRRSAWYPVGQCLGKLWWGKHIKLPGDREDREGHLSESADPVEDIARSEIAQRLRLADREHHAGRRIELRR